jgi:hypothetical protein
MILAKFFNQKIKSATTVNSQKLIVFLAILFNFAALFCGQVFAATVTRINSKGNLFLLKLETDEKFESGDKVFVVYDGQLKTTGLLKFEEDGTVSIRLNNPLPMVLNGSSLQLSHDQSWIMKGDGKNQLVTGVVAKISSDKIYIKMDERFQPVFGLKQPVEIQLDETLQVVPAVVMEYRTNGVWFKAAVEDLKKLTEGAEVSFPPPPPRVGISARSVRKKLREGDTSLRISLGAQQLRFARKFYGASLGLMAISEISMSEGISLPIGIGWSYYKMQMDYKDDEGHGKSELSQSSFVIHTGASFKYGSSFSIVPFVEYHYGLVGEVIGKYSGPDGSSSAAGTHQATAFGGGLIFSFQFGPSRSIGVELGSYPSKSTVTIQGVKNSTNALLTSERLFVSFAF